MGFLSGVLGTSNNYQYQTPSGVAGTDASQSIANQGNTQAQQQALLSALQQQAAGNGPNPAQMQLNQATQANNAQNAGFLASQKGINPAIAERLAGQNAAQANQTSAGQAATLGAQQQLAAQNAQLGVLGQQQQANLSQQQMAYNNSNAANQVNAGVSSGNQQTNAGIAGGVLGGIGSALGGLFAGGGEVGSSPLSSVGNFLSGSTNNSGSVVGNQGITQSGPSNNSGAAALQKGLTGLDGGIGSMLKAPLSQAKPQVIAGSPIMDSGQIPDAGLDPSTQMNQSSPDFQMAYKGGNIGSKLKSGGHVPGTPKVPGNSYANDTVKALLSPGEVVIPNSVMQSKDPVNGAAKFVAALMKKKAASHV